MLEQRTLSTPEVPHLPFSFNEYVVHVPAAIQLVTKLLRMLLELYDPQGVECAVKPYSIIQLVHQA
jgi:hypothetical protein